MLNNPEHIRSQLRRLGTLVRQAVIASHGSSSHSSVARASSADTIYAIDEHVEPVIESFFDDWSRHIPLVLVAEGIEPETGRVFPAGSRQEDAPLRIILDPIDGTRGLMYDKRAAWFLAGAAPNKGPATRLSDIQVAVMTELPTSKMAFGDVLWAIKGQGAHGARESLTSAHSSPLALRPSQADTIAHGFASIANFFPGTKVLASRLMEEIARTLLGEADVHKAMLFDDQYISTGGQFYELIVGHDRFNADLRTHFYRLQNQPEGLCCHPYDCCTALIAREAGILITDGLGNDLDGPLDVTTGLSWAAYANDKLRRQIEPIVTSFLSRLPSS